MLKEIEGDLLSRFDSGEFNVIVHGCNCRGTLGDGTAGGIAKAIGEKYLEVRDTDRNINFGYKLADQEYLMLGQCYSTKIEDKGYIVNMYTQLDGGRNFEYSALIQGLADLDEKLVGPHGDGPDFVPKIGFPYIGCGIGGGDIETVKRILEHEFAYKYDVTLVKYKSEENDTDSIHNEPGQ